MSGKGYIAELNFTHVNKRTHYFRHITFSNYTILDDTAKILLYFQQVVHQLVSGKRYIAQLDYANVKKKINYSRHIVFSNYAILDDSARI